MGSNPPFGRCRPTEENVEGRHFERLDARRFVPRIW